MEYHKTKDILYVKEILGHKSINNTLRYTQLVEFEKNQEFYNAKVAHSEKEVCELIEAGYELYFNFKENPVFRKRK